MLKSHEHVRELADRYEVDEDEILMMGLQFHGVDSGLSFPRMRFEFNLLSHPDDIFYTIVSLGRQQSPFFLDHEQIVFDGEVVGRVRSLEDDDVVVSYFRKAGRVLTVNSNARSHCTGCVFCYNTLSITSDPRLRMMEEMEEYVDLLMVEHNWSDTSHLDEVCVCTGCFQYERAALDHLRIVRNAFVARGFKGELGFLSSVLRSEACFDEVASHLLPFRLTMTVECFSKRNVILKQSKASLTPDEMPRVLERARSRGLETDFTYIVGMDSVENTLDGLDRLLDHVTECPRLQVYQAHNEYMHRFAHPETREFDYFLRIRRELEPRLKARGLMPRSWRNYRPLWYFDFAGTPMTGPRI
jgi:hypothetical protein